MTCRFRSPWQREGEENPTVTTGWLVARWRGGAVVRKGRCDKQE